MKNLISFLVLLLPPMAMGESINIDEAGLSKLSRESNPTQTNIKALRRSGKLANQQVGRNFDTQLELSYGYSDTDEDSLTAFAPEFGPTEEMSLGVTKRTVGGVSLGAALFANQMSTVDGSISDATRVGGLFTLNVDLWKNVLGRMDRANVKASEFQNENASLRSEIQSKQFELNVRKLYWTLVANEESIKLTKELLKTAEAQLKDTEKRRRAKVASKGELARSRAQVDSRKTSITSLEFQREMLLSQLRSQLPSLGGRELSFQPVNFKTKVSEVLQCVAEISQTPNADLKATKWAQVINVLNEKNVNDVKAIKGTGGPDLYLNYQARVSGVEDSYSKAQEVVEDENQTGHTVGLTFRVPLGGDSRAAEQSQLAIAKYNHDSEVQKLRIQIQESHIKVLRALRLLNKALENQQSSNENLKTSVEDAQKKYKQARISVNSLMLEQDAYFASALSEIDIKLQVIHTLLDYFKVFTEHTCQLNNLRSA